MLPFTGGKDLPAEGRGRGADPPSLTWWMGWEGDDSYSSQCPYAQTKGQKGLAGQPYHWRKIHLISESEVVVCWGGVFVVVFLFFGVFFAFSSPFILQTSCFLDY